MEWYFERESKTGDDDDAARTPSKPDFANDSSSFYISLNNATRTEAPSDRTSSRGAGGHGLGGGGGGRWEGESKTPGSPQPPGSLREYLSSLADESFCSHKFTLVG